MSERRETERRSPRYDGLESWPTEDILGALLGGQMAALNGVAGAIDDIARAVEAATARLLRTQGRLVYAGAGTSGRLAVLDGVELEPTFGWPRTRLGFLMAGGDLSMQKASEGAEDDQEAAKVAVKGLSLNENDVVIGVAASGTTPFTRAVIQAARTTGALTISIASNQGAPLLEDAEIGLLVSSGAEVLAGSTRLGAGTAQKATLNLFSTALMARLHRIHRGYMVDMIASNDKLTDRAARMVMELTGCGETVAQDALKSCEYRIKQAVLVVEGAPVAAAQKALDNHDGNLAAALVEISNTGT